VRTPGTNRETSDIPSYFSVVTEISRYLFVEVAGISTQGQTLASDANSVGGGLTAEGSKWSAVQQQ